MRLFCMLGIILMFSNFVLVNDFIEVGISYGGGSYGSTAVKFEREGLLYRYGTYENFHGSEKYIEKSEFIPLESLDRKKVQSLQMFLHQKDIFNLDYRGYADSVQTSRKCISIDLRSSKGKCKRYCYRSCNSELDSVVVLLNSLLPRKVNEAVIIPPICE